MDGEDFDLIGTARAAMHYALENFTAECKLRIQQGQLLKAKGYEPPAEPSTAEDDDLKTSYLMMEAHPHYQDYTPEKWEEIHAKLLETMNLWSDLISEDTPAGRRRRLKAKMSTLNRDSEWLVNMAYLHLRAYAEFAKEQRGKQQG